MAIVQIGLRYLRCKRAASGLQRLPIAVKQPLAIRTMATMSESTETESQAGYNESEARAELKAIKLLHQGVSHARAVPVTPSYFTKSPKVSDLHVKLSQLLSKCSRLPCLSRADSVKGPQPEWRRLNEVRREFGEEIKAKRFAEIKRLATRLFRIQEDVRPPAVLAALKPLLKPVDPLAGKAKPFCVDEYGRSLTIGRRKTSTARAYVIEGTGEVYVNGKTLSEAFGRVHDRESAVWALSSTDRLDKYNVWATTKGGGTTGQAEALTLAIGRGVVAHEPDLKHALRRAGCLSRDPRKVERKLHGHLKARKSPAWVKR